MDAPHQVRRAVILQGLDVTGLRGAEIGPLSRPLISKDESEVYYVDHCTSDELRTKYADDPTVQCDDIAQVDFVWSDKPSKELMSSICPLDYVVASHVIEHVPDLIGWLHEMHDVLHDGGSLLLAIPDKRFTFDVCRRTSAIEEIRLAHTERRRRPGLRTIMDHFANVVRADARILWDDYTKVEKLPFMMAPPSLGLAARDYAAGNYIDVHCWVFTPWSFLDTVGQVVRETGLGFDLQSFQTTAVNDMEFFVRLVRVPRPTTDWTGEALAARRSALVPQNRALDPMQIRRSESISQCASSCDSGSVVAEALRARELAEARSAQFAGRLAALECSTSWRVTAPMRSAVSALRARRQAGRSRRGLGLGAVPASLTERYSSEPGIGSALNAESSRKQENATAATSIGPEATSPSDPIAQTARHWDQLASKEGRRRFDVRSWGAISEIQSNHNRAISGDPEMYWVDYFINRYFPDRQGGDVLALGCGEGGIERLFHSRGLKFRSITGYDISPACVEKAISEAKAISLAENIRYQAVDLNIASLPPSSFDFVFFFHSLHHVENVRGILAQVASAMRPDAVLMVNEFVGPTRFQWTDLQVRLSNAMLQALPTELRLDLDTLQPKEFVTRRSVNEMVAIDPSEAVNSAAIETELKDNFRIVEERNWGGTLSYLIFENIAGNFAAGDPYHSCISRMLVEHENSLIEAGVLPSDFKHFVATLRP